MTKYYDTELALEKNPNREKEAEWWSDDNGESFTTAVDENLKNGGLWLAYNTTSMECLLFNHSEDHPVYIVFKVDSFDEVKIIRKSLRAAYRQ